MKKIEKAYVNGTEVDTEELLINGIDNEILRIADASSLPKHEFEVSGNYNEVHFKAKIIISSADGSILDIYNDLPTNVIDFLALKAPVVQEILRFVKEDWFEWDDLFEGDRFCSECRGYKYDGSHRPTCEKRALLDMIDLLIKRADT